MKKFLVFSLFLSVIFCRVLAQDIPAKPNPPRLVNDFANQLNATEKAQLEQKLRSYNDSTSSQIVIVVVPTTGDYPIADYAFKIGREWGVGQKDKDNGIVILWASTDRKIYISVGYGMEGVVPDAIAKRIITQVITPDFKNGMFYRGLDRGVDAILKYATGEYKAEPKEDNGGGSPVFIFLIIFIVILFIIYRNRNNRGGGGGGFRNFGGPILFPYSTFSGGGSSSGNWGGGGDGGGFGGFGGGSFGGGGAGGDY